MHILQLNRTGVGACLLYLPLSLQSLFHTQSHTHILISSLLHYFLQAVHDVLATDPRSYVCLEHGCLRLQQPVHGEVPPGEGCVPGPQSQRWTDIIGPISDIEYPLEGSTSTILLSAGEILPKDHLLAHVVRATGARVGVEREQHKPAVRIKTSRVCENLPEKVTHPGTLQPRLDEVHVGIGDHRQLEVLLVALQILEEVQEARRGWDLLHRWLDWFFRHALVRHINQDLLHVLIVVPLPVAIFQPVRQCLARQSSHHSIITALIDDGLIKVEQNQKALLLWRCMGLVWWGCHL